jgi:YqaJ-like viral recombinase domain
MQLAGLEVCEAEQNSAAWFEFRRGLPSTSKFQCLLANSADRKGRKTYMYDLAGEIISGECVESYSNQFMERGKAMEAEARDWYAFATDAELIRVGAVRSPFLGAVCSPDSLIGNDGGLEIKTRMARLQLELLESGELPNEHKAQVQGAMWITGRSWWDFCSYAPKIRPFKIRVSRDERYIATLAVAVKEFNAELKALVEKFR